MKKILLATDKLFYNGKLIVPRGRELLNPNLNVDMDERFTRWYGCVYLRDLITMCI